VKLPKEGEFEEWKKGLMKELRERSFRSFPAEIPPVKVLDKPQFMTSEPGIEIKGYPGLKSGELKSLIVYDPEWTVKKGDLAELTAFAGKWDNFWLVYPRGIDHNEWTKKSPPTYVERAHALLGRTVDEGRVWDVIATAKYLQKEYKSPVRLIGAGQAGVIAAYAALLEPSIKEVILVDPPASHRDGPIFLNVLRVCDVPDALGMLAPTPLTLIGAKDKAFDRTEQIYKAAGAAEKLQRK
jgi:hypothetical protein